MSSRVMSGCSELEKFPHFGLREIQCLFIFLIVIPNSKLKVLTLNVLFPFDISEQ